MKRFVFALVFASSAMLFSCKEAQVVQEKERSVSVQGTGEVVLEPDSVSIVFSVNSENWDVNTATQDAATRMTAVQAALQAKGVEEKYIASFDYSIRQEYAYNSAKVRYRNYIVSNKIRVQINDVKSAGGVIDAAVGAGANELNSLTYNVKDDSEAVKRARMLAVKQAEETAQMLAGATGATLGRIMTIREYSNSYPIAAKALGSAYNGDSEAASTPLPSGTKVVSVSVDAVYELE